MCKWPQIPLTRKLQVIWCVQPCPANDDNKPSHCSSTSFGAKTQQVHSWRQNTAAGTKYEKSGHVDELESLYGRDLHKCEGKFVWLRVAASARMCVMQVRAHGLHQIRSEKNDTRQPANEGWGIVDARMSRIGFKEMGWVEHRCLALSKAWPVFNWQKLSAQAKENGWWTLD